MAEVDVIPLFLIGAIIIVIIAAGNASYEDNPSGGDK